MRLQLAGGSVKRLVYVLRDSRPLPGEKAPAIIAVEGYATGHKPKMVAEGTFGASQKQQQFLIEPGEWGDRLLDVLKKGAVKPMPKGDAWVIDLDRIKRATD